MKHQAFVINDDSGIILPIPENYKDCFTLIRSDFFRKYGKILNKRRIFCKMIFHPFDNILLWFRLCQHRGIFYPLTAWLYRRCEKIHRINLPMQTRVGYGLYLGHHMCMVIHKDTVIGNNVNLSQFLNIGSNHGTPAVIGDGVYIGPMVCLVENVRIGSNSVIGAGAVVTRDIPAGSVAAGVPAKVLKPNCGSPENCWEV